MAFLPCTVDGVKTEVTERHKLYSDPMSKLRGLMISRMAKPEEVLIVEDENGNIVRETLKDNDVLVQYKVPPVHMAYLEYIRYTRSSTHSMDLYIVIKQSIFINLW